MPKFALQYESDRKYLPGWENFISVQSRPQVPPTAPVGYRDQQLVCCENSFKALLFFCKTGPDLNLLLLLQT